jgi:hypothetical protein
MTKAEQIRSKLLTIAKKSGPSPTFIALVKSVNDAENTCVVEDENGTEITDVRLKFLLTADNNIKLLPKVGANVLLIKLDGGGFYVISADKIDALILVSEDMEISMEGGKIGIKKGSDNLGKLIKDLVDTAKSELHKTNVGLTLGLTPTSATAWDQIKNRANTMLKS